MKLIPSSLLLFNKHKEAWLWPTCKKPKTLSFRANPNDTMFKTVNSVYFDPKYAINAEAEAEVTTNPDSCFTNSSESASISTESEEYFNNTNEFSSVENIVRGAMSERLLFEPGPTTGSILESNKQCINQKIGDCDDTNGDDIVDNSSIPYKESVAMAIESHDPQEDFKKSMEEMVKSHELKDWECLEELLGWYLKMNGKNHHELIVGAFLDLLAGIFNNVAGDGRTGGGGASSSNHSTPSFTSVASNFTSPIFSHMSKVGSEKEIIEEEILLVNH